MNGVIEWEENGKPTGEFSPYIKIGRNPIQMPFDGKKPIVFKTHKEAKKYAKAWEIERKSEI